MASEAENLTVEFFLSIEKKGQLKEKMGYLCRVPRKVVEAEFGVGNLHDYGARWYDASIGRFTGVDPIADQFAWVSPFNYAENEPVGHIDLWGLQAFKDLGGHLDAGMHSTPESYRADNDAFTDAFINTAGPGVLVLPAVIVSAPAIVSAAPSLLRNYAINAGETLVFESAASLLTEGDLSQVDIADATIGGLGFWYGAFGGSLVDYKLDGTFQYANFLGGTKDRTSVGLDIGYALIGYGINKSLSSFSGKVSGFFGQTAEEYAQQISKIAVDNSSRKIIANYNYNKYLMTRMSRAFGQTSFLGKSFAKSKDFFTPYFQKKYNNGR